MQVILDTNILLSGLLTKGGTADRILTAFENNKFKLVCSEYQIEEIKNVSRRPKIKSRIIPSVIGRLIKIIRRKAHITEAFDDSTLLNINDNNDLFLVVMSEKSKADYLVTGDKRAGLFEIGNIGRTKIVTATEFVAILKL